MKDQQIESPYRDAGIGKIEYRAEEKHVTGSIVDKREIEHVHNLAEHERSTIPDNAIKEAIDNITKSTGCNQSQTDQYAGWSIFLAVERRNPPA